MVTVNAPENTGEFDPYDFETIFRNEAQEAKYRSPFESGGGDGRRRFSSGGQVAAQNDILLRLLGDT